VRVGAAAAAPTGQRLAVSDGVLAGGAGGGGSMGGGMGGGAGGGALGGGAGSGGGDGGKGGGESGGARPMCVAWSTSIVEAACLAVGCSDGSVQLWTHDENRNMWVRSRGFERLAPCGRVHADCVRGISWAADMGRSHQLLASGSRDKLVKLWALRHERAADEADEASGAPPAEPRGGGEGGEGAWSVACCAELPHRSQVCTAPSNAHTRGSPATARHHDRLPVAYNIT
jgi:hypothetical protein